MGIITDAKGNKIREFDDTLEDWRQAAQVEARLRRKFHTMLRDLVRVIGAAQDIDSVLHSHEYAKAALDEESLRRLSFVSDDDIHTYD